MLPIKSAAGRLPLTRCRPSGPDNHPSHPHHLTIQSLLCSIPELEFEIGAGAYVPFTGDLTTVAAVLMKACRNLNMNQAERRAADADTASKIDDFIQVGGW